MTEIGWATLGIIPSFRGFDSAIDRGTSKDMATAGKKSGKKFGDAFARDATGKIRDANDKAVQDSEDAGGEAGGKFGSEFAQNASSKIGTGLKTGLLGAGALAGIALGVGINGALQQGALSDKLAAQLGVGEKRSAQLGRVAGRLYSGAYGESLEQVNESIRSVVTNLGGMARAGGREVGTTTKKVLDLTAAFEEEPNAIARAADQMVRTGMAKNATRALNLITRGFQTGGNEAEDLLDTFSEYGTQFRKLGLGGKKSLGLLSQGLKGGARDADIVADALKEFSLRTTEPLLKVTQTAKGPQASLTALGEAFKAAGVDALDADPKMAKLAGRLQQDIAGGGEKATAGLQLLLDGLRNTDDPLARNRNAVALFGTQAEDLGDALLALDPSKAEETLGRVGGAARKMGSQLSDNAATKIESFKRTMTTKFVNYFADNVIPFIEDDVLPAVDRFSTWFTREGGPAIKDFADDMKPLVGHVEDLVGFINDLPKSVKIGGLGAIAAAIGGAKLVGGGGGGGALGTVGKIAGLTKATKVFETNPAALGGGVGGGGKAPGFVGKAIPVVGTVGLVAGAAAAIGTAAAAGVLKLHHEVAPKTDEIAGTPNFGEGLAAGGFLQDMDEGKEKVDALVDSTDRFKGALDLVGAKKVNPDLRIPNILQEQDRLGSFASKLDLVGSAKIRPNLQLMGVEHAHHQIDGLMDALAGFAGDASAGIDAAGALVVGGRGRGGGRPRNAGRDRQRQRNLGGVGGMP